MSDETLMVEAMALSFWQAPSLVKAAIGENTDMKPWAEQKRIQLLVE